MCLSLMAWYRTHWDYEGDDEVYLDLLVQYYDAPRAKGEEDQFVGYAISGVDSWGVCLVLVALWKDTPRPALLALGLLCL
jgi:hypothetical protein